MEKIQGEGSPETRNCVFLGCRDEYEACGLVFAQCRPEGSDGERLVAVEVVDAMKEYRPIHRCLGIQETGFLQLLVRANLPSVVPCPRLFRNAIQDLSSIFFSKLPHCRISETRESGRLTQMLWVAVLLRGAHSLLSPKAPRRARWRGSYQQNPLWATPVPS